MKRLIGLVVSVCLTALLISSCSDSGTESGVEFGLAKEQIPSTAVDARDAEGGKYSRSSDCEIIFDEARYVDHKLHKLLGKCDTVNEIAAYIGRTESTATLTQWFKRWCTSEYGSTTTIIDADEQQCSSGTGVYNVGTVGYVNKYGDLVAAYSANSGGQSKSLWGKNHYCNSGKSEGRTYSGLSSASCSASSNSTSTTSSTTSSSSYEGYVNKYGDLLAAFNRVGGSKVNWGKKHYCNYGRTEGRTYSGLSTSSCSTTTTTTTTTTTSSGNAYEGYVNKYGDLLAAFNRVGGSKVNWGKKHYCNYGRTEGRTYSGLSTSSCSSTTTTTTATTTSSIICSHFGCGPYKCTFFGVTYWGPYPCKSGFFGGTGGGSSSGSSGGSSSGSTLCPDGSYVGGSRCRLCPDGSYVGGSRCNLTPGGSYVGGSNSRLCPDGTYVSGSRCTLCPDGSYVGGSRCNLTPGGSYVGN